MLSPFRHHLASAFFTILAAESFSASVAWALPQVELGMVAATGLDEQTQPTVRVYRDVADPLVYWWAPYQVDLERSPSTLIDLLSWSPHAAIPRLSVVAGLRPFSQQVHNRVRADLARQLQVSPTALTLRPMSLVNVALTITTVADGGVIAGDWKPLTSLIMRNLPETVALTPEENERLLALAENDNAWMRVKLAVHAVFAGYRTQRSYTRSYEPSCIIRILAGTRRSATPAGRSLTSRRLFGASIEAEANCVSDFRFLGDEPTAFERAADWQAELVRKGVIEPDGMNWRLAKAEALNIFATGGKQTFAIIFPEGQRLYDIEFGRLLTELHPTE